jgi:hypothetical protein
MRHFVWWVCFVWRLTDVVGGTTMNVGDGGCREAGNALDEHPFDHSRLHRKHRKR